MKPSIDMSAEKILTYPDVDSIIGAGYDLRAFTPRESIETSLDWFDLLQKNVFPADAGVRYYLAIRNGEVKALLPVKHAQNGFIASVDALANYYTSLYTPLVAQTIDAASNQSIHALIEAAANDREIRTAPSVMRFAPMDIDSPAYAALFEALQAIGWKPFRFLCFGNWFLEVDSDWEGYLKKRSAHLRSTIKRMNKKFFADGGNFEIASDMTDIENKIRAFQQVYSASWKIPEPYPEFIPALIRRLAGLGMLRLGIASIKGVAIAAQLWIAGDGKASIYKVAYHENYAPYSPGTILTSHVLQHVIEQDGVREVDFLMGDDKYKQIWMSHRRERWGIVAYNPRTFVGLALFLKESAWREIKEAKNTIAKLIG
ncbi:GNAT family N-acetyltransferase [Propionivibrio limicola]|uniref:GNAT family N-acetyltransferase n=1 Tax=Propionivibrio limicola TaxID=167645 RepID=UPI001292AD41|nr:GNAT family N-acetyltransferase [Propionivibrio limicola]